MYVSAAALAGAAGSWFYWNPAKAGSVVSQRDFNLGCSAGWVWAPAILLLLQQGSSWSVAVAALGAAALAEGLRCTACAASSGPLAFQRPREKELFAESIQPVSWDWRASVISVCIYAAFFALDNEALLVACIVAAVGSFLFVWQLGSAREGFKAYGQWRVVTSVLVATLATALALWVPVRDQEYGPANGVANSLGHGSGNAAYRQSVRRPTEGQAVGSYGYQSIILWPLPPKKEIMAPLPAVGTFQGIQIRKPLILKFDGPYWYFQPPETRPGLRAHVTHGDPLEAVIHSTNFMPLVMEAHEDLTPAVRISRCREIQVVIENRDNLPGNISVGMLLTDSVAAGKPTLYLGQQAIKSSEPNRFRIKLSPVEETLRFPVPSRSAVHEFDQITLVVNPDRSRLQIGAKIAFREFKFLPR